MTHNRYSDRVIADGGAEFVTEWRGTESTTQAILRSIAAIKGVAEPDIGPLYQEIEIDALETMLHHADEHNCDVTVEFTLDGYIILARGDGSLRIIDGSLQ